MQDQEIHAAHFGEVPTSLSKPLHKAIQPQLSKSRVCRVRRGPKEIKQARVTLSTETTNDEAPEVGSPTVHRTQGKTNLDWVYDQTDPAAYFEVHGGLDYIIAESTGRINRRAIKALKANGPVPVVAELCAGYGLSTATMTTRMSARQIFDHYEKSREGNACARDKAFFQEARDLELDVIGVDIASNALAYGKKAGLFTSTIIKNLELNELDRDEKHILQGVRLVTATGAFSYITTNTLERILGSWDAPHQYPVFMFFPLVATPMEAIRQFCKERGMQVYFEPTKHWLPQRRFKDDAEKQALEASATEHLGEFTPPAHAREGYLHATPFVACPKGMDLHGFVSQILDQPGSPASALCMPEMMFTGNMALN